MSARLGTSVAVKAMSSVYAARFRIPRSLAYDRDGLPAQPLYRVRFRQREVWPDYAGPEHDTIDVEIYQHWLEEVR